MEFHITGSEGGPGKLTSCKAGRAPRSDPYTYCRTASGWVYTAFVTDVFARRIVGWKCATSMTTGLVQAAIDYAIHDRIRSGTTKFDGLVHHSDAGAQYTAVAYSTALTERGILPSIGSVGDSYDNALAESINSSYKAELVDFEGGWQGLSDLQSGTAEWVHWYNHGRPNGYCHDFTPARAERIYYDRHQASQTTPTPSDQQGQTSA